MFEKIPKHESFFLFFFWLTNILRAQYSGFDSKMHRAFSSSGIKGLILPVIKLENFFTVYAYMLATLECLYPVLKARVGVCVYAYYLSMYTYIFLAYSKWQIVILSHFLNQVFNPEVTTQPVDLGLFATDFTGRFALLKSE